MPLDELPAQLRPLYFFAKKTLHRPVAPAPSVQRDRPSMVTRPAIASTASTIMASWFSVRRFRCGLSVLRVAMISCMVRFGSNVGCCDEPSYSTFSDHPSLYDNYAFAIVRSTATFEAPGCHVIAILAG